MRRTVFLWAAACLPIIAQAKILCVDANASFTGMANGTCWSKPYRDLQDALSAAEVDKSVNQIWIADGIYKPSKTYSPRDASGNEVIAGAISLPQNNPGLTCGGVSMDYAQNAAGFNHRLITFHQVDGVSLHGGFQGQSRQGGGENALTARSPDTSLFPTILDGNLGDDDNPDRVWHVVTVGNDIAIKGADLTLDRLVIRNGDAGDAPYFPINFYLQPGEVPIHYHDDGGGLYVFIKSKVKINDVTFARNNACAGGAMFAHDGSRIEILNSQFLDNSALNGGALTVRGGGPSDMADPAGRETSLLVSKSLFMGNKSFYGSAILLDDNLGPNAPSGKSGVNATITKSRFIDNPSMDATFDAGTINVLNSDNFELSRSLFDDHGASASQSLYYFNGGAGTFEVSNNHFLNQNAFYFPGSAMQLVGGMSGVISGNVFRNNNSGTDGGALWICCGSDLTISNNLFEGNSAASKGGGVFSTGGQSIRSLQNNRLIANSAPGGGGAILLDATNGAVIDKMNKNEFQGNAPDNVRTE